MKLKFLMLVALSFLIGLASYYVGLSTQQAVILAVFSTAILGTLFFWDFRLSFVFIGSGVFFFLGAVDMENFIKFASLDVVIFLISMMIIVGMMKDAGLFAWLITLVLRIKHLTGRKMFVILMISAAFSSALMDEVTSIIIVITIILNIAKFLEVDPKPLVIASVMATNIGSAATVLGNPVGILIAARSKLSFEDFIVHSFPISVFILFVTILIMCFWYRDYIRLLSEKIAPFQKDKNFLYLISIPPDLRTRVSIGIFAVTILLIILHKRLELFFGIDPNSLLIMIPVISAGIVMLYRHDRARHYIEHEVEWPSLLFFMFLFAQAGVIRSSGIAAFFSTKIFNLAGDSPQLLTGLILFSSGILSSFLDNVVTVASNIPIILSLQTMEGQFNHLWWALLFGACYGGNISMIGSTANIVALGILEKEVNIKVTFVSWIKIGATIGLLSMAIAYFAMLTLPIFHIQIFSH